MEAEPSLWKDQNGSYQIGFGLMWKTTDTIPSQNRQIVESLMNFDDEQLVICIRGLDSERGTKNSNLQLDFFNLLT